MPRPPPLQRLLEPEAVVLVGGVVAGGCDGEPLGQPEHGHPRVLVGERVEGEAAVAEAARLVHHPVEQRPRDAAPAVPFEHAALGAVDGGAVLGVARLVAHRPAVQPRQEEDEVGAVEPEDHAALAEDGLVQRLHLGVARHRHPLDAEAGRAGRRDGGVEFDLHGRGRAGTWAGRNVRTWEGSGVIPHAHTLPRSYAPTLVRSYAPGGSAGGAISSTSAHGSSSRSGTACRNRLGSVKNSPAALLCWTTGYETNSAFSARVSAT